MEGPSPKLWTCPKCKRRFRKENQAHSCKHYPLDNHFKGKEKIARPLFNFLKGKVKKDIGNFKVVSLPCCIHLETSFSFAGVYARRDRIRIFFTLDHELKSPRIDKFTRTSKNRYLYTIDIKSRDEIDKELLGWLSLAYHLS
jgi:hypothetical protein